MKSNGRLVTAMLLLFTAVAVAMLWGLNQRSQAALRTDVLARAEQRSLLLADAMAGQVSAELALIDHSLQDLRASWLADPTSVQAKFATDSKLLPAGLVVYMSEVSVDGVVVRNSQGLNFGLDISARSHFQPLLNGVDQMVIGVPVLLGTWLVPVGRPLYRNGQFAGAVYFLVATDRIAHQLGRLALDRDDVVVLVNPEGKILAQSLDNSRAMGTTVGRDRPFLQAGAGQSGTYQRAGAVDNVRRVYGWHRLPGSDLVVVVGLRESSVLAPVLVSMGRSNWLTAALSAVLLLGGVLVTWLLWRDERTNQAMRESEQLLKRAQRLAKLGYWSLELRTREFTWSDEVYRILGMQRGTDGTTYSDLRQRVHPDDLVGFELQFEQAVKEGVNMDISHRIFLPDGRIKHLQALGVFEYENGMPVRCRGSVQDTTEIRAAQLALEGMNIELEARVDERTRELASLNNELEAFSYSVSHDLRTPLRSIHGFATLLDEESERLSQEGRTHLRRIQEGARRMGLLITDLLTMAQQSRAVINKQRLNLSEMAQAVVFEIEREDPQRKVIWHIESGLWIWADLALMRVVLQNLLGNAWKYSSQTAQAEISFRWVNHADGLSEFCVRDNGAGFDMAYVGQLFQPFKRLHAHHEFEGSGVGLVSVQRLVQRHGGTVRAEGAVGKGAAMFFSLPDDPIQSQASAR